MGAWVGKVIDPFSINANRLREFRNLANASTGLVNGDYLCLFLHTSRPEQLDVTKLRSKVVRKCSYIPETFVGLHSGTFLVV